MEFIDAVRDIVTKLQEAGKTEQEITEIIMKSADAATVRSRPGGK